MILYKHAQEIMEGNFYKILSKHYYNKIIRIVDMPILHLLNNESQQRKRKVKRYKSKRLMI